MKMKKRIALFLSLLLALSVLLPASAAFAEEVPQGNSDSGLKVSKTATANNDGTYTIRLEAYATGVEIIEEVKTEKPTDIVLVLDQSGSMAYDIGSVKYTQYTGANTQNKNNYAKRHNNGSANLWYKLPDGSYVSVSVELEQGVTYTKITKGRNDSNYDGATNYWENQNNLFTYVDGELKKVVYTRERPSSVYSWNYTYALEDGTILNQNNEGRRHSPTFQNTDDGFLYLLEVDEAANVYTYTYTDRNGDRQTIETPSTGADTHFSPAFYQRSSTTSGGGRRLDALKGAVTTFADAVADKAAGPDRDLNTTDDNVNHRIAVVGFADTDNNYGYNTGVFIGSTLHRYQNAASGVYGTAFQNMDTTDGINNVQASVNALKASGATRTDYGLAMAKGILDANPVLTNQARKRVVIVFTDGAPTNGSGFQLGIADSADGTATAIKNSGITVYSIGIFSGADASQAGSEPEVDYVDSWYGPNNYSEADMSAACNWFMQKISSNNGTPRNPSYYLSAGDAEALKDIFEKISDQIQTEVNTTTLNSSAVVKDIISPYFTLTGNAEAASITLETYKNTSAGWERNEDAMGARAVITNDQDGNQVVSVTGFNFSENWCGTEKVDGVDTYRGNKLVISFTVNPKSGFLGGNGVPTNAGAGIYENAEDANDNRDPVATFDVPTVNVPIPGITVNVPAKNVYLLGSLNADQIKSGTTIKVGDVNPDPTKEFYGLQEWQYAYVNITDVVVKDVNGITQTVDNTESLTGDNTEHKVRVTISPNQQPAQGGVGVESKTGNDDVKINVFKPVLTFKDSEVYYGAAEPTQEDLGGKKVYEVWMHGDTASTAQSVTMIGNVPTLRITYTPDSSKIAEGKVNTKQDIEVSAEVEIGETLVNQYVTFVHQACNQTCSWSELELNGDPAFLLHVKTCQLTITKTGGASGEPYVFTIKKDGEPYSEVTIEGNGSKTIYELPVGIYTIVEDTGWSWRYSSTPTYSSAVILSKDNTEGAITCTNEKKKELWLNGYSEVKKNVYDDVVVAPAQ